MDWLISGNGIETNQRVTKKKLCSSQNAPEEFMKIIIFAFLSCDKKKIKSDIKQWKKMVCNFW